MRTKQYRYTEWVKYDPDRWEPSWNKNKGSELYDHDADPGENINLANEEDYSDIVAGLSDRLHKGWRLATKDVSTSPSRAPSVQYCLAVYSIITLNLPMLLVQMCTKFLCKLETVALRDD